MKRKNKFFRISALLLALLIGLSEMAPVLAEKADDTIYIDSVEDLQELSKACSLDTWSWGKTVVLQSNISLSEVEFSPIPTFGGTFEGNGYTISGLEITGSVTPAGLFGYVQESAVIKDLNVSGHIEPSGDGDAAGGIAGENSGTLKNCSFEGTVSGNRNIGGIVGINASDGIIENCRSGGAVFGQRMTGGISGYNMGAIVSCENHAYINITSVDPSIKPEDIDVDTMLNFTSIISSDADGAASDTGGIAGYSAGGIVSCKNSGTVGYQHIGYNVGGIAGRSCGYIRECENTAEVYGRKDVGGIAGQIEPYISQDLSPDTLTILKGQLNELNGMVNRALDDSHAGVGTVTDRLNKIADYVDSAAEAASDITTHGSVTSSVTGQGQHSSGGGVTVTLPHPTEEDTPETEDPGEVPEGDTENPGEGTEETPGEESGDNPGESIAGDLAEKLEEAADKTIEGGVEGESGGSAEGSVSAVTEITLNTSLHGLAAAVNGMSGQMRQLNGEIAGNSGTMTEDLKAISNQINLISNTVFDAVLDDGEDQVLEDTSESNIDQVTFGKTSSSKNTGFIYGDINVGGITGSMAVEYELDPEDDVTAEISGKQRQSYEMKAILQNCVNEGEITSKRSYAGGICGRMDLGYITGNENYGDVESESGSYVGGVSGLASGTIYGSYAKCTLKGKDYIGGIVGSGAEDYSGEAFGSVDGCYSLVSIPEYEQYAGAISGADTGSFTNNYFVSEELAGMNRISYEGHAEPVSYETLSKVSGLPERFQSFTVRFVADDKTVQTLSVGYGESLGKDEIPEVPQKEGCYGKWDIEDFTNLCFDTTVTAVYSTYVSALTDEEKQTGGHPLFFVEGNFDDQSKLTVTELTKEASDPDMIPEGFGDTLIKCFTGTKLNLEAERVWKLEFSPDGQTAHKVRYLIPEGDSKQPDIYVKQADGWVRAETEEMGSYLTFTAEGTSVELAAVRTMPIWWVWIPAVLLIIGLFIFVIRMLHKRKSGKKEVDESTPQAENETPAIEHDGVETTGKKKKRKKWLFIVLLLCCVVGIFAVWLRSSGVMSDFRAYELLKNYAGKDEITMELTLEGTIGSAKSDFTALIDKQTVDGKKVTVIENNGMKLYYAEEAIWLENGKAYKLSGIYPDYSKLLEQALEIYRITEISAEELDGMSVYTITSENEDAKALLEILLPSAANDFSDTQSVTVRLLADKREVKELRFQADGALTDEAGTEFSVSAALTVNPDDGERLQIPQKVQEAISAGTEEETEDLSEDLYRLIAGWSELESREPMAAKLKLSADCGPVVISEDLELYRSTVQGMKINSLHKNGYDLYFTENTICDKDGNSVSAGDAAAVDAAELIKLAYELCMNGDMELVQTGTQYVYALTLDQKGMEEVVYAIAPEAETLNVSLDSGSLRVTIKEEKISSIELTCKGGVEIMTVEAEASFGIKLQVQNQASDYSVPEKAVEALKEKEGI